MQPHGQTRPGAGALGVGRSGLSVVSDLIPVAPSTHPNRSGCNADGPLVALSQMEGYPRSAGTRPR
jgi:hypothetical protein